jgi:hypothetical protein
VGSEGGLEGFQIGNIEVTRTDKWGRRPWRTTRKTLVDLVVQWLK